MHRHRLHIKQFSSSSPTSETFLCRYSSEDDLLVDCKPLSTEIGLGGVFIGSSLSIPPTQDSQASSVMYDSNDLEESVDLNDNLVREMSMDKELDQSIKRKGKEKTNQLIKNAGVSCKYVTKSWMANKALL